MAYELTNSFDVCFNIMKIKYHVYDQTFDDIGLITPNDSINVFINLESVLNYLSCINGIDKKLVSERDFPTIITADILNLAAHYKRFFRGNNLPTKVFLYMTDLCSEVDAFKETKFNDEYRSYYLNKYNTNPKYSLLTEGLKYEILPDTMKICEFIQDVHLIVTKNIDSSVVPYVVGKQNKNSKNVIITSDIYDTQYSFEPNYVVHYLRRSPMYNSLSWNLKGYIKEIIKREPDQASEINYINNVSKYLCLLSVLGDKPRSIEPIRRVGAITVMKNFKTAMDKSMIDFNTESIELLKDVFPDDMQEELIDNFYQYSIKWKYESMSESDKYEINSNLINRFDNNSLLKLNATKFYNHQLMLEELTN